MCLLDKRIDAFKQIMDIAVTHPDANRIHLITHGKSGLLHIGQQQVDSRYLSQWRRTNSSETFSANTQLLIYACDLAKGDEGKAFVDKLASTFNIAVAASTNITGNQHLGYDAELE